MRARIPGKLNYSSAGIGTPLHLIGEMFKQRLGLDIVHVPYKSGGLATQAVMAGETQSVSTARKRRCRFYRAAASAASR